DRLVGQRERRVASDHRQAVQFRQVGNQVLREASRKKNLLAVGAKVGEWQHGNGRAWQFRGWFSEAWSRVNGDVWVGLLAGWVGRHGGLRQRQQISAFGDGPDERLCAVLKRVAEVAYGLSQGVIGDCETVPNRGKYLVAADNSIGVVREEGEQG